MNVSRKLIAGLVVALALVGSGAASVQSNADSSETQISSTRNHWCC